MSPKPRALAERFWEKVDQSWDGNSCWPWLASYFPASKGGGPYGRFVRSRLNSVLAHRTAYELSKGQIAEGLIVRHTCDNPSCCNPAHLILGTHKDNAADREARKRGLQHV